MPDLRSCGPDELRAVVWTCEGCHEAVPLVVCVEAEVATRLRVAAPFLSTALLEVCPAAASRRERHCLPSL
jgi:hypothetical protein